MSVFSGQTQSDLIGRPLNARTYLSPSVQTADDNTYDPSVYAIPSLISGSGLFAYPVGSIHVYEGDLQASVNTPFYQGVYFQQEAIIINLSYYDVGFVTEDIITYFQLFSTSSEKRTVQSLSIDPGTSGINIVDLAVSDVFNPYEEKTIGLEIPQAGNALIDATFSIKFVEDPITYVMAIQGARTGAFYLAEPDWSDGIRIERRFLTSIFKAQDMSESRKVLRNSPLRSLEASLIFFDRDTAGRMWALSRDLVRQTTAFPWFPDRTQMTAAPGTSRVYCETEYRRFQAGRYAFLVGGDSLGEHTHFEVVRVDEVFSDGFSTEYPIVESYVSGDTVYPAFVCYAAMSGDNAQIMTDRKGILSITAEEKYADSVLGVENTGYSPIVRNGLPTLDVVVTFSEEPSIAVNMGGERKVSGRGEIVTTQGVPYMEQTVTALCDTKEVCWNTIGFFNHLKGRGKPFWVRSELDFLNILSTSGNNTVVVDNANEFRDWTYLQYLWVEDSTGVFDIIRIVTRSEVSGGFQFILATNSLADISSIWQAHSVRLSEDVIQEEYLTDAVMMSTFTVQELQGFY